MISSKSKSVPWLALDDSFRSVGWGDTGAGRGDDIGRFVKEDGKALQPQPPGHRAG
jgi:hypothetical protein